MFVSIKADLSDFTDEIADAARDVRRQTEDMSRRFERVGQSMMKMGKVLTVGVTLPLLAVAKSTIEAASDAEEMQSKFETVFGSLSGDVSAWARETAKTLNRSRFDLMAYASSFQDTFVPMGFARDEAAELSKTVTQLGIDLASFNNTSEDDALASLQSALIGNHEAVRKFGVLITAATLDAELMRMGIEGGTKAATEQEKIMARLGIILGSTSDAQGDAARTAGGFANQIRGLQASVRETAIIIGTELLPVATKMVEWANSAVRWFTELDPATQSLAVKILALAAAIGPALIAFGFLIKSLAPIAGLIAAILSPVGLLVLGLSALTWAVWDNWDAIKEWVSGAVEKVGEMVTAFIEMIAAIATAISEWDLKGALVDVVKAGVDAFHELGPKAVAAVGEAWSAISGAIAGWAAMLYDLGANAIQGLVDGFLSGIPGLARAVGEAASTVNKAQVGPIVPGPASAVNLPPIGSIDPNDVGLFGNNSPDGLGFGQGQNFGDGFSSGVENSLQIQSPSKVMKGIGENIMAGLRNGLEESEASLTQLSGGLADKIAEPFMNVADTLNTEFQGITSTLQSHIEKFIETGEFSIKDFVSDLTGSWMQQATTNFAQMITGILNQGFTNLAGNITGAIGGGGGGGLFSALGSLFNGLFGGFRAGGGLVPPWKSFVAGERGAELIEQDGPSAARRVYTAGRTSNMGGGGLGRLHVTVSGARGNSEIRQMVMEGVQTGIGQYDRRVGARVQSNLGRRE